MNTVILSAAEHVPVVAPTEASGVFGLMWLIIALPALGAVVLLLGGRRTDAWGHLLATALPIVSFVLGVAMFVAMLGRAEDDRQVGQHLWTWFETSDLSVGMDLLLDPLSILFVLLITGVGSLIHVYSIGYMAHDPRRRRFFAYLNLFLAAMLTLVLADNYLVLFLGWEGVGLASYLLIGFWQHKPSAAAAAKKAFVINRVGDMGLSTAIMLAFVTFGSTSFAVISAGAPEASETTMTILGLLLLLGACGKSAQVPLQAWLLDAMEGPTPVSALIHAATMVTAGVYLVVRSNFVFELAPAAQTVVVVVAVVTLLWGAVIGCAKDDVKKVLAGSTMSQIGYMMLGAGLGVAGYAFAIFHLLTHGFFKANMFLGAGSVMHAMDDDVDMRRYGGLRLPMPVTFLTFAMGYLAIIGFPGFSGFFSKDKIIETALAENLLVGSLALLGAGITGFYMTRLMLMTFFGKRRWRDGVHPHESPAVMTGPLVALAALSVLGGVLILGNWISDFLTPVVGHAEHAAPPIPAWAVSVLTVAVVAVGVTGAWLMFGRRSVPEAPPEPHGPLGWAVTAGRNDLYGDQINDTLVVGPGATVTRTVVDVDKHVVDGVLTGGPVAVGAIAGVLRRLENGYVRSYALSVLTGAVVVIAALLAVNLA
ncbi:NADH-quinone oxidoreductase subunit L [Nocardioides insulae]|uniref:NADH-quinone oxidoreductase subunit L n=1 Tax=Nocardioides insulae TaxID=394734 RepID=UPI0003FA7A3F|nr:NADH-quinone oxidoreductase subunit L [Nocardioides insulae]